MPLSSDLAYIGRTVFFSAKTRLLFRQSTKSYPLFLVNFQRLSAAIDLSPAGADVTSWGSHLHTFVTYKTSTFTLT